MSDLIDRQAAIDALVEEKGIINGILDSLMLGNEARKKWEQIRGRLLDDIEIIANLPSAEPERKMGKWVESNPQKSDRCRLVKCSECGFTYIVGFNIPYDEWVKDRNYCQRCGAKMENGK